MSGFLTCGAFVLIAVAFNYSPLQLALALAPCTAATRWIFGLSYANFPHTY